MKLMWFHLMPYTELPDDFREKHPSVWVDIHSSLFDPRRAHHMYNDFMDELEFAAECGFDAVCVNEQRYVNIWPRPVQKPHPPVWIPGGGSVETWQWCAQMDYVYAYLSYFGYKDGQATMSGFWDEMARLGKDRNPYRAGFLQFVGVAESRAQAMELYREPAEYFYGRCLRVDPRWAVPPGYITEATQRAGIVGQIGRAASLDARQKARATTQMEDIVDRGYVIIGSPDEVAEQLKEVATSLNVGHLMMLLQFGSMGKDLAKYNTKLFADKVMPQLTGLFPEWEDRWWPAPMPKVERAEPAAFAATLAAE